VHDVGCSQGTIPILLVREARDFIGVDISLQAIEKAMHHQSLEPGDKAEFINADLLSLLFVPNKIRDNYYKRSFRAFHEAVTILKKAA